MTDFAIDSVVSVGSLFIGVIGVIAVIVGVFVLRGVRQSLGRVELHSEHLAEESERLERFMREEQESLQEQLKRERQGHQGLQEQLEREREENQGLRQELERSRQEHLEARQRAERAEHEAQQRVEHVEREAQQRVERAEQEALKAALQHLRDLVDHHFEGFEGGARLGIRKVPMTIESKQEEEPEEPTEESEKVIENSWGETDQGEQQSGDALRDGDEREKADETKQ